MGSKYDALLGKLRIKDTIKGAWTLKGNWNADTNTPTLASGTGDSGDLYVVSVAGSTNLDGITTWNVGDELYFDGTVWQKVGANALWTRVGTSLSPFNSGDILKIGDAATYGFASGDVTIGRSATNQMTITASAGVILQSGIAITGVLDEDDMATDSNVQLATQQSIKAYVDASSVASYWQRAGTLLTTLNAGDDVQVDGKLHVAMDIGHVGDADTFIRLQSDLVTVFAGGRNMLLIQENGSLSEVIINNDWALTSFRVYTDDGTTIIKTDPANNRVGIGTATPSEMLTIADAGKIGWLSDTTIERSAANQLTITASDKVIISNDLTVTGNLQIDSLGVGVAAPGISGYIQSGNIGVNIAPAAGDGIYAYMNATGAMGGAADAVRAETHMRSGSSANYAIGFNALSVAWGGSSIGVLLEGAVLSSTTYATIPYQSGLRCRILLAGAGAITNHGAAVIAQDDIQDANTLAIMSIGRFGFTTGFTTFPDVILARSAANQLTITASDKVIVSNDLTVTGDLLASYLNLGSATDAVSTGDFAAHTAASGGLFYDASAVKLKVGLAGTGEISCPGAGANSEQFGIGSVASGDYAVALGYNATASGSQSFAVGGSAVASQGYTVAIGANTDATVQYSTAIGYGAQATAIGAYALGPNSDATGGYCLALGADAQATGNSAAGLGYKANASGSYSVALGYRAIGSAYAALSIGPGSDATQSYSTALGGDAQAIHAYSFALGKAAATTKTNQMVIGRRSASAGFIDEIMFGRGELTFARSAANQLTITASDKVIFSNDTSILDSNQSLFGTGNDMGIKYDGEFGYIETNLVAPSDLKIDCGTEKTLELVETVWKDINLGAAMLSKPASGQPDQVQFVDEVGANTGIYTFGFAVGEKVSGNFELQHDYKEGTDLFFHVHWQGSAAPTGTDKVQWELTFTVSQTGTTLNATTTIVIETDYDTQYEFTRSDFAAITGTDFNIEDQFLFTIERIAASVDEYGGDAIIATVGVHYETNTLGSRQIGTK